MIGIKFAKRWVKLAPGTKVSLEYHNSMFSTDSLLDGFSLPLNIPVKGNTQTFEFANEMLIRNRKVKFEESSLYYSKLPEGRGTKIETGSFLLRGRDATNFSGNMNLGIGSLPVMTKKLRELNLGGDINLGATMDDVCTYCGNNVAQSYPNVNFTFPTLFNEDFYGDANPDYTGYLNLYDATTSKFKPNNVYNKYTIVPCPFLLYVLKQGFADAGYTMEGAALNDEQIKREYLYSNYALDDLTTDNLSVSEQSTEDEFTDPADAFSHAWVHSPRLIINFNGGSEVDIDNCYNIATGKYTVKRAGIFKFKLNINYDCAPLLLSHDFDLVFHFDGAINDSASVRTRVSGTMIIEKDFEFTDAMIGSTVDMYMTMDAVSIAGLGIFQFKTGCTLDVTCISTPKLNTFAKTMNLVNHVPDRTFGNLFNAWVKKYNIRVDWDHNRKKVLLTYVKDKLRNAPTNYEKDKSFALEPTILQIQNDNYRSFNYNFGSDDDLVNENFKDTSSYTVNTEDNLLDLYVNDPPTQTNFNTNLTYVKNTGKYYIVGVSQNPNNLIGSFEWLPFCDRYRDYYADPQGTADVRSDLAPLFMRAFKYEIPANHFNSQVMPEIKQQGSSIAFGIGVNEWSLRSAYYYGLSAPNDTGGNYPYSSSLAYDNLGNVIADAFNSLLEDDGTVDGLYKTNWKPLVDIVNKGEYFRLAGRMKLHQFLSFNLHDTFRLEHAEWLCKVNRVELGDDIHVVLDCYKR